MIIQLTDRFSLGPVLERLDQLGLQAQVVEWRGEPVVVVPAGEPFGALLRRVRGVAAVQPVGEPFQLASRSWQRQSTVVECGAASIGGPRPVVVVGLSRGGSGAERGAGGEGAAEPALAAALALAAAGVDALRFSLSTAPASPYTAEGPAAGMVPLLAEVRRLTGLPVIVEVDDVESVADAARHAEGLEVGPASMGSLPLLRAVSRTGRPVLLRRGPGATIEDWLLAAERILAEGNPHVALCDQGLAGSDPRAKRLLDLAVVPRLQSLTHLPVLIDPVRGTGERALVPALARAAVAAGAQGVVLEVAAGAPEDLAEVASLVQELRAVGELKTGARGRG